MVPSRLSDLLAADLHILLKRKQELRTEGRDELLSGLYQGIIVVQVRRQIFRRIVL